MILCSNIPDDFEKIKTYYNKCTEMCKKHGYNKNVLQQVGDTYFSYTIGALKQIVMSSMALGEKYKKVSMIVLDSHLQNTIREVDIKKGSKARKILMDAMKHKNCIIAFILIELGCIKNGI